MERIIKVINDYRPDAGFLDNSFSCDIRRRPAGGEVRVVLNRLIKRKRELSLSFWLWRQEIKRTILAWFYL